MNAWYNGVIQMLEEEGITGKMLRHANIVLGDYIELEAHIAVEEIKIALDNFYSELNQESMAEMAV